MGNCSSFTDVEDVDNCLNGSVLDLSVEILAKILDKLPPKDVLSCRLVCKQWEDIVSNLLHKRYSKAFNTHHTKESPSFDLCYFTLYSEKVWRNLLKDMCCKKRFKYWKVTYNGFNVTHKLWFRSQLFPCVQEQHINIAKDKYLSHVINQCKPHIYAGEVVHGTPEFGTLYQMTIRILCKGKMQVEKTISHTAAQGDDERLEQKLIVDTYPDDVEKIIFEHRPVHVKFWERGMTITLAYVHLLLQY